MSNIFIIDNFWTLMQGHTLRLLSLPDFLDASIGKILKVLHYLNNISPSWFFWWKQNFVSDSLYLGELYITYHTTSTQLKQKLSSATAAIKSVFGQSGDGQDSAVHPFMFIFVMAVCIIFVKRGMQHCLNKGTRFFYFYVSYHPTKQYISFIPA
jgi:hypothetical protein